MRAILHPFTLAGWLVAGVSIALAAYFYSEAQDSPQLSYTVKPIRGVVVRSGRSSKMAVRYDDRPIGTDVTAAQVVLWNEGRRAVKRADILKPIAFHIEGDAAILEASILKCTRDVVHPTLNTDDIRASVTTLTWDILERGDGCTVQLLYEGHPDIDIYVDGAVEGQKSINSIQAPEGPIYRREFNRPLRKDFEAFTTFLIVAEVIMIPMIVLARDMWPIWARLAVILFLLCNAGVLFHHLLYGYVEPPFGF